MLTVLLPECALHRRLPRTRPARPHGRRATEKRDELASVQLIKLHSVPASQGRIAGYRIGNRQSAGIRARTRAIKAQK